MKKSGREKTGELRARTTRSWLYMTIPILSIVLAAMGCTAEPTTDDVTQELGACPIPEERCQAYYFISETTRCNTDCIASSGGGNTAYCPPLTDAEVTRCMNLCNPLLDPTLKLSCYNTCAGQVMHICTGGELP
jgi:hypothetical protein